MHKSHSGDKSPYVVSRGRDYLRPDEANALIEAGGRVGRQPLRDLLRLIYRHGLRAPKPGTQSGRTSTGGRAQIAAFSSGTGWSRRAFQNTSSVA